MMERRITPVQLEAGYSTWMRRFRAAVAVFFLLTKPAIVALLLATTLGGMLLAQAGLPPLRLIALTLLGGWLAASGASTLNSYIDRDIDGLMSRTARRPLPAGKVEPLHALLAGLALSLAGVLLLARYVNTLSAALSLAGIVYYVIVYTVVLKRTTPHSVVIGGLAGALPPLVGWAAVTGSIDALPVLLAAIVFAWTPPHTWALVLLVTQDYERVDVPMLPVVRGEAETRREIVLYSVVLSLAALLPFLLRELSILYVLVALPLSLRFVYLAVKLWRDQTETSARRLYRYSTVYLALLFLAMVIDHAVLLPWV